MTEATTPIGAIVDTNSGGRFDLIVYEDGILAVKGTYVGVALRAGGAGMVGGGGSGLSGGAAAGAGSAGGTLAGRGYEQKRVSKLLAMPRSEVLAGDPENHFVPVGEVVGLVLRKRWHGHSLTIVTRDKPTGRKYSWKPALNSFDRVCGMLQAKFGESLVVSKTRL
jgi:hypothetical protein